MSDELRHGLITRYSEITRKDGPLVNYVCMSLDLSVEGEVRITMGGYVKDVLSNAEIEGTAKMPATDGLFELRPGAALVPEERRAKFYRLVAMVCYLAKRCRQECMPTTGTLAGQVTRCTGDDWEKLTQLVKYVR